MCGKLICCPVQLKMQRAHFFLLAVNYFISNDAKTVRSFLPGNVVYDDFVMTGRVFYLAYGSALPNAGYGTVLGRRICLGVRSGGNQAA
jgi:hypothetical protein